MGYYIGVDIGGTKINTALIKSGKVIKKRKVLTEGKKGKNYVIKKIIDNIEYIIQGVNRKEILGIGIGVPGSLNKSRDTLVKLPNLKSMEKVPLKKIIQNKFKLKTILENDTNLIAIGEKCFGVIKNKKNAVCLTLGTGVGGSIIIDGKIYHGKGSAGEIGHMTIMYNGIKCYCGNTGCLEQYASGRAVVRESRKLLGKTYTPLEVEKLARKGNKKAIKIYESIGNYLGIGLANIVNILDSEIIVLGGGLSKANELILRPAIKEMKERAFSKIPEIKLAKLGDDAGAIGATCLFNKKLV